MTPTRKATPGDKDILAQAIDLARLGKKAEARHLIEEVCRRQAANAKAWLWRASLADSLPEAIGSLERVLALEPGNATARVWLEKLRVTPVRVETYHCFLCGYQGRQEFEVCPRCSADLSLNLASTFRNHGADAKQMRQAVERLKAVGAAHGDSFDI